MKKRYLYLLSIIAILTACSNKPVQKEDEQMLSVASDTSSVVVIEEEYVEEILVPLQFKDYLAEAYIIDKQIRCYDEEMKYLSTQNLDKAISQIQVIGKSTIMYPTSQEDAYCLQVYFLKIKLSDGLEYIVDGSQVYGIAEETKKHLVEYRDNSYKIFVVSPFKIGAADDEGLTGCDEYYTMIIEDIANNTFSLVKNRRQNAYYADKYDINYFYFRSDEGVGESISHIESTSDYICLYIEVALQEGRGTYELHITKQGDSFYWSMHNEERFED